MKTYSLDDLKWEHFNSYESGKIVAGIRYIIVTEDLGFESHECYQFDSLESVVSEARSMERHPSMALVRVMTHRGEYKNMRVLHQWINPRTPVPLKHGEMV